MRGQNVYGNRHSPSKDIANNFAVLEYLRFICAGEGLQQLYNTPQIQAYLNCIPSKELNMDKQIYSAGQLRKVLSHTSTYF